MKFEIINRTEFSTEQLIRIVDALLEGQIVPNFYLICQTSKHDGLSITNIDKPLIIITIKDLHQFAKVFVHELVHIQQHVNDYATEDFPEIIVTDKHKTRDDHETKTG